MNIIVVIADTFRYDNIYPLGRGAVGGPHLDAFARQGVSLHNFYTGSFPTIPQRTDFTTGRVGWPWYPWQSLLRSGRNHLPRLLAPHGYVSQLIGDCPHLIKAQFDLGFTGFHQVRGQEGDTHFLRLNHEIRKVIPPEKTRPGSHFRDHNLADLHRWINQYYQLESQTFAYRTASLAEEWLEENYLQDPFFLWVDFFDPHEPWDPPEYLVRKYDDSGYDGPPLIHPNYGRADVYTDAELSNLRAHYLAEAFLVDRSVGRILQKIEDLDLFGKSIVIFMSDHGMSTGEHNRTGKSNIGTGDSRYWPIFPEVAHCPFIIRAPQLPQDTAVSSYIQPCDILPTLAELVNLNLNYEDPIHGRSFAGPLRGEADPNPRTFAVTASFSAPADGSVADRSTTPVVYSDEWIYVPIDMEGETALFDRTADPMAETNVVGEHPAKAKAMQNLLNRYLADLDAPERAVKAVQPLPQG